MVLATVGERSFAFALAGPRLWNNLPDDITVAPSLPAQLSTKTENTLVSAVIFGRYFVVC